MIFERPTRTQLLHPARICLRRDDADHIRDVVAELLTNRHQASTVVRARNDAVAAQLAAQDLDLCFQEPNAGVPASGAGFKVDACRLRSRNSPNRKCLQQRELIRPALAPIIRIIGASTRCRIS